ncbi:TldD/PmbA family protein [Paraburkholderia sp. BCC1885]|uniref:TldD/PmbA family protein n=1 Tax=Paraburkholderia sp. BCC1885 TaxID=2562669 RepID=UPI001C90E64F|nr:metallopeptidase TldD-related protein [Paraburkholderia sp. BCC1885]
MRDAQVTERTTHSARRISVVTWLGHQEGRASSADLSAAGLAAMVKAACAGARHAAADPCSQVPEGNRAASAILDLHLAYPWHVPTDVLVQHALDIERAGFDASTHTLQSEGVAIRSNVSQTWIATTRDFSDGYIQSTHSASATFLAVDEHGKQRASWSLTHRNPLKFGDFAPIGREAALRSISRLGGKTISSRKCPVVFDSTVAGSLLSAFARAAAGTALYRRMSFLERRLGTRIAAAHLSIVEQPFLQDGLRSQPFDSEGVAGSERHVVRDGMLEGYFLSAYSARRLDLKPTGNADGPHNLRFDSTARITGGLASLLRKMGSGLLVTGMIGESLNPLTGDYSRGAFGFWVEKGEVVAPVERVTIAGNLWDMLGDLVAVSDDDFDNGGLISGSVLLAEMAVGGQ